MKRIKLKDRILPKYTKGEEIFNMTSHIVGAVLGIVATVLCIVFAAIHGNTYGVVSGAIYGATRLVNIRNYLGCCNTWNCIKFNRYKKIQSLFNDLLFTHGMVHYI